MCTARVFSNTLDAAGPKTAVGHPLLQGLRNCARLLVDFLQHEVAVFALLGRIRRQLALGDRPLDRLAAGIPDLHTAQANVGDVPLFEEDETPGHWQQRRHVGRDEMLADAHPDHDRATAAGKNQPLGIIHAHDDQRVGALQFIHGSAHGSQQADPGLQMLVHPVDDDLGIGIRFEAVATGFQFGA
jgi:hypothetical protein